MSVVVEALRSLPQPARRGRALTYFLTAALLVAPAAAAMAQAGSGPPYHSLPSDPKLTLDSKEWRDLQRIKGQVLQGSLSFAENRAQFENWYKGYLFPSFTKVEELHRLSTNREDLRRDLRNAVRFPEIRTVLMDLTYKYMLGIATSPKFNFHPASRVNAMLVLGELNQSEGPPQQRYPDPYARALDGVLLPQFSNEAQSDAVRLAAQVGILRHAQLDWTRPEAQRIPIATRQAAVQAMMTLLDAKDPPANRSPQTHTWMQRRAIEIVAALGAVGPRPEVNKAIERIMLDANADIALRCTAGAALKQVNVSSQQKQSALDANSLSLKLGALAVSAIRIELDRIDKELEKTPTPGSSPYGMMAGSGYGGESGYSDPGSMMGMGMPGMPMPGMDTGMSSEMGYMGDSMGYGMPSMAAGEESKVDLSRRRFKGFIQAVQYGLDGMRRLATDEPAKTTVKNVSDQLTAITKATDPPEAPKKAAATPPAGAAMYGPGYMESGGVGAAAKPKLTLRQLSTAVSEALLPLEKMTRGVAPPAPAASAAPVSAVPDAVPAAVPAAPATPPAPAATPPAVPAAQPSATPPTPAATATPGAATGPAPTPTPPASTPAATP